MIFWAQLRKSGIKWKSSLTNQQGGTTHYIIKCDPGVHGLVHSTGDKLYLKWGRHSVYDKYNASMCFYCLKFGHNRDKCHAKTKNGHPKCFKCAEAYDGHSWWGKMRTVINAWPKCCVRQCSTQYPIACLWKHWHRGFCSSIFTELSWKVKLIVST